MQTDDGIQSDAFYSPYAGGVGTGVQPVPVYRPLPVQQSLGEQSVGPPFSYSIDAVIRRDDRVMGPALVCARPLTEDGMQKGQQRRYGGEGSRDGRAPGGPV